MRQRRSSSIGRSSRRSRHRMARAARSASGSPSARALVLPTMPLGCSYGHAVAARPALPHTWVVRDRGSAVDSSSQCCACLEHPKRIETADSLREVVFRDGADVVEVCGAFRWHAVFRAERQFGGNAADRASEGRRKHRVQDRDGARAGQHEKRTPSSVRHFGPPHLTALRFAHQGSSAIASWRDASADARSTGVGGTRRYPSMIASSSARRRARSARTSRPARTAAARLSYTPASTSSSTRSSNSSGKRTAICSVGIPKSIPYWYARACPGAGKGEPGQREPVRPSSHHDAIKSPPTQSLRAQGFPHRRTRIGRPVMARARMCSPDARSRRAWPFTMTRQSQGHRRGSCLRAITVPFFRRRPATLADGLLNHLDHPGQAADRLLWVEFPVDDEPFV